MTAPRPDRGIAGPAAALLCGALGSLLPGWAAVPVVLYGPVDRVLRFARVGSAGGSAVEISLYGVYLCAALCALVGALIGAAIDRRSDGTRARPLLTAWALTALGTATAYQVWTVWP